MSMRMKLAAALGGVLFVAAAAAAQPAPTNYRALLVGVSSYPNLSERLQLKGPQNDARRMRELLLTRGVPAQNIRVLADGVEGAELPTRAAILGALEQLARTAKPNDYIVIHVGGHGSQMPVPASHPQAAAEPDGLFEIFLPRDVQNWTNQAKGADGEVKNAILDAEFRVLIDRMTASGAFVWAIFDTCHSATMVRSMGDPEVRLRQVTPDELGIPRGVIDQSVARASRRAKTTDGASGPAGTPGRAVYFYAAQTTEPTPEANLPYGVPGRQPHGLFSFNVIQTLESANGPITYEQLGQQVLTRYAAATGERTASPLFSGTALRTGVLGQSAVPHRQWQLKTDRKPMGVAAGKLSEIYEGSVLAILPDALSPTDKAIGYVRVSRSTATDSEFEPIAHDGKPAMDLAKLAEGRIARMVQPGVQFALNVGVDLSSCTKPCAYQAPLASLQKAANGGVEGAQIKWQNSASGADVVLKAAGNRLWFLSGSTAQIALPANAAKQFVYLDAAASATPAGIQRELTSYLRHASKATNLLRIATSVSNNPATAALKVEVQSPALGTGSAAGRATVKPGDRVQVTLTNTSRKSMDVTVFYIDSKYGIGVLFPQPGESNRLENGASTSFQIDFNDSTLGLERLAIVGVEAEKHGELANLSFLAQDTLASSVVTRGAGGGDGFMSLFTDAGFATQVTRGGSVAPPPSSTGMQVITFNVLPGPAR